MSVQVKEVEITEAMRKKLGLPKWVAGYQTTVGKVTSYGTLYGFDWRELEGKKFQNTVARVEKAGFICVIIGDDDYNQVVAVKGPLGGLSDAQAKALFGTSDFQRADRMD